MLLPLRVALAAVFASSALWCADAGITLIGMGAIDGDRLDLSRLRGQICQKEDDSVCIPRATLGGFGSAIAYTGHDNVFLAVPDRGPFDGRTNIPYANRAHFLHMVVEVGKAFPNIRTTLVDTQLLTAAEQPLVGDSSSFSSEPLATMRFDPEGVAIGRNRTFYISDEYGPYIYQFDRSGVLIRRIGVPAKFAIAKASGDVDSAGNSLELYPNMNTSGRQANRGMEGLAITPDGRYLVGIMQNSLIQDNGLDNNIPPGRVGANNRILRVDTQTGRTEEFVYVMDAVNQGRGVNEILALNDHEFLVLERDNRTFAPTPPNAAAEPLLKRIYRIDLNKPGLTDVSSIASLPGTRAALTAANITPVDKSLFLDLLDPSYKVDATRTIKDVVAEKLEGICWGPDLPDGRHVLYVLSDNDLFPGLPTKIYAFAVDGAAAKVNYQPQELPQRLISRGKVEKALGKQ